MEQLTYNGCFDFVDGTNTGDDYSYNENGALSKDLNKKILSIEYDFLGNPKTITLTQRRSIEYVYSADGRRLRAIHKTGTISEKTDYIGNLILKGGKPEMYRFAGGYASFEADTIAGYHYYITDYLGNNRMVVNALEDTIEQVNHYYAYGGIIGDLSTNEGLQVFKFGDRSSQQTGKIEYLPREDEGLSESPDRTYGLDLMDFEARQYDAITPWFTSIDPLAEDYTWLTPYNYCAGDPVNLIDPDGRKLKLNGSEENVNAAVKVYNDGSVGKSPYSVNNGYLTVDKSFEPKSVYDKLLCKIINSENETTLNIESGTKVVVGDINTAKVDISDIQALSGRKYTTPSVGAFHEAYEQSKYQDESFLKDQPDSVRQIKAHNVAEMQENAIKGTPGVKNIIQVSQVP